MHNEFFGRVLGAMFQIGNVQGDLVLNTNPSSKEETTPAGSKPPDSSPALKIGYVLTGVLLVVIIMLANACGVSSEDPPFPDADQGERPSEASDEVVGKLIADKLRSCADAPVRAPANCPQAYKASSQRNIRWELVSDPRDGMQVRWNNGRVAARGTAVMVVNYNAEPHRNQETVQFHFLTEFQWRGADTQIDVIRQPKAVPPPGTIKKDRFTLPDDDLIKAVRETFEGCAVATSSPMPPPCPRTTSTPNTSDVTWSLDGDPVGGRSINKNDAEFGVLRVTASYSLIVRKPSTDFWKSGLDWSQAGNYEATLVRTSDEKARVLAIKHVP